MIFFSILLFFLYKIFKQIFILMKRRYYIENYPIIIAIVDEAKKIAFEKQYLNNVIVHIASDSKITGEELGQLSTEYLKDVAEYSGPDVMDYLEYIHGDLDSLYLSWSNEFRNNVAKKESEVSNLRREINNEGGIQDINNEHVKQFDQLIGNNK